MPNVGGKKFSYDKKGMDAAKEYAKETGKPMKMMKKGGKVKKMMGGGKCRGMGAATSGGKFKMS